MQQTVPPAGDLPGKVTTKRLALGVVTKIEAAGPGGLVVTRGMPGAVAVSAMPEDHERIEVKVDGETLKLGFKGGMVLNRGPQSEIRYEVTTTSPIEELKLGHGIATEVVGLEASEVKIKVENGSRLTMSDLRAKKFEIEAADGSQVVVSGTVERQKAKVGAGSSYQGAGLDSTETEVEAEGGSQATVRVREKLKARASGGASVSYVGEGIELDVKTEGGSMLRQLAGA